MQCGPSETPVIHPSFQGKKHRYVWAQGPARDSSGAGEVRYLNIFKNYITFIMRHKWFIETCSTHIKLIIQLILKILLQEIVFPRIIIK